MALLIPADITKRVHALRPANGKYFSLDELRSAINAQTIEIITANNGELMVCDEEGKFVDQPVKNQRAAEFCVFVSAGDMRATKAQLEAEGITVIMAGGLPDDDDAPADWIAGDVLLCNPSEIK